MIELPDLLQSFGVDLKKTGSSYKCKCYTHDDNNPSMSVYMDDAGKWWAHCYVCPETHHDAIAAYMHFTGCDFKEADKAVDAGICGTGSRGAIEVSKPVEKPNRWMHSIPPAGTIPDMDSTLLGNPVKVWTYRNNEGVIVGYIARYENNGKKDYRPYSYGTMSENLKPSWQSKTWATPRPLYNADKLANSDGQVVIVEGEKTADAAECLLPKSITCITWPGGSGGVRYAGWDALKGRNVILIPDSDPAGVSAMEWLAKHLLCDIKAAAVSVIDTSNMPLNWDLADALDEGWTTAQTIAWAKEYKNAATLEPVNKKAAQQAAIDRANMEKKTPVDLSVVEPPAAVSLTTNDYVDFQNGNVISIQSQRLDLSPVAPPKFSEIALARSWSESAGKNWRYVSAWNTWMQWDGSRWIIDCRNSITNITADNMVAASNWVSAQSLTIGQRRSICSKKNIANVLSVAGADPRHATVPDDWDKDPFLLGTPDGVVDLKTGEMRKATPNDCITKNTAVSPKRGDHPVWDKLVLDRCTKGDPEMRKYYQRWAGYMLTGDCREEAFLFLHGAGGSGKSKFVDCLGDLMGDYCVTAKVEMLMESKVERHTEEIACLAGARLVRTSEPEEGSRWNEALLKLLTGRDTVSARRLYEKQFTFRPQFKLVMSGNFRPALKSTGEEIRRRMHFVEFPDSIPEKDRIKDLSDKLRAEWPAILQWMIDGCLEWQKHGLMRPDAVVESTEDYLSDEDSLGQWIDDCCIVGESEKVLAGDAYQAYKKRAESHGEKPTSQKRFSQRMEARGFGRVRTTGGRYILGLKLKDSSQPVAPIYSWE